MAETVFKWYLAWHQANEILCHADIAQSVDTAVDVAVNRGENTGFDV